MNALRTGTIDSGVLTRPVSEMNEWECEAALQYMDDFPEPLTLEEKTLWDHLVSEAEAENEKRVGGLGGDLHDAHQGSK